MALQPARPRRAAHLAVPLVLCLALGGGAAAPVAAEAPAPGTEILWDRYGGPHIFAPDHASLFYAYGYAQMEAHAELLVRLYAQARGRGATLPVHPAGDYRSWQGVVPGDRSDLIAAAVHPYEALPKVVDPSTGWLQNANDMPWTSVYPMMLDPKAFAPGFAAPQGITPRAQRAIRILSTAPATMTFEDIKRGKLDTRLETADQFVDEIVSTARASGTDRAKRAAAVLASWDRQAESTSEGTLLFYRFMTAAGPGFSDIGGFRVAPDDRRPLDTPRGFRDAARAMALLDTVAGEVEREYGSLRVRWGDVLRFRRGHADYPGNGAPSSLGAIRTINVGPFVNGRTEAVSGDTFYAVVEFSTPQRGEALLGYGNWSKPGSKHVEDQIPLLSRKQMRPIWRSKAEIEANLEARRVF